LLDQLKRNPKELKKQSEKIKQLTLKCEQEILIHLGFKKEASRTTQR